MEASGAVDSLLVPSGWGLSPPPHGLAGFPIPAVRQMSGKARAFCASAGFSPDPG